MNTEGIRAFFHAHIKRKRNILNESVEDNVENITAQGTGLGSRLSEEEEALINRIAGEVFSLARSRNELPDVMWTRTARTIRREDRRRFSKKADRKENRVPRLPRSD